jgi:hypothetical protein
MFVMSVGYISADALQSPPERPPCIEVYTVPANAVTYPATPLAKRQRIRTTSEKIGTLLDLGYERSLTFRRLVETLEQSPVLVYIESGRCPAIRRQRLNGCLADLGMAGGARYLRIIVDVSFPTDNLIATVGHELQHAVEARQANAVAHGHREAFIGAGARHVGANVYETHDARNVKEAILRDLRRATTVRRHERRSPPGRTEPMVQQGLCTTAKGRTRGR